jgi:hypothetical protein
MPLRMMPRFSIIIPTYNRCGLLRESLDSVLAQEFTDYEVIVVDDGSQDDTPAIVAQYGGRVRLLSQCNRGPGPARNRGVEAARGEYVAFLDSDDLLFPWSLRCYAEAIVRHDRPSVLLGQLIRFRGKDELSTLTAGAGPNTRAFTDFLAAAQEPIFWGSGCAVLDRQVFLKGAGFTNGIRVFEDQDFGLRLGTEPGFVKIDAPPTVAYRASPSSLTEDLGLNLAGIRFLLEQEACGRYPGGEARRWERRRYIGYSVRSVSFALLRASRTREALDLCLRTFGWHAAMGRLRFALGFPLLCAYSRLVPGEKTVTHHSNANR